MRALREFRLLDGLVARLTPDEWLLPVQRPETDDPWTVKDALAHITAHKADFLAELSGASTRPRNVGVHTYNRRTFEAWHDRPVDEITAWHRSVQQSLVDALRAAPETWFDQERTGPWPAAVDGHSRGHRTRDLGPALRR